MGMVQRNNLRNNPATLSLTPLNCALNALILALNDSAAALVALLSKKNWILCLYRTFRSLIYPSSYHLASLVKAIVKLTLMID